MRHEHGFQHAWVLPHEIDERLWLSFRRDATVVLRSASAHLESDRSPNEPGMLRGPHGLGLPEVGIDRIALNGSAFRGQAGDPFVLERRASAGIVIHVGAGRTARAVRRCDTRGYPYDLAVCALLLLARDDFGDKMRLGSSGGLLDGWRDAASIVRRALGRAGHLIQSEHGMLQWTADQRVPERERVRSSA